MFIALADMGSRKTLPMKDGPLGPIKEASASPHSATSILWPGFLRLADRRVKRCLENVLWIGVRRLCHAVKTKKKVVQGDLESM